VEDFCCKYGMGTDWKSEIMVKGQFQPPITLFVNGLRHNPVAIAKILLAQPASGAKYAKCMNQLTTYVEHRTPPNIEVILLCAGKVTQVF
jgi:hypothetical protein